MVSVLAAEEMGGIHALEAKLDEIEKTTPAGIQRMMDNWGKTPEAVAAQQMAEGQFGIVRKD